VELKAFFARNLHLAGWVRIIALAQGGAEHYLRGRRGIWDLDVIVCFAEDPGLPRLFRRMVVSWDWGPSKLGALPVRPAGIYRPRCRCRLLGHAQPGGRGRWAAGVAGRTRRETRQPRAEA
jgi:hypothetical protein